VGVVVAVLDHGDRGVLVVAELQGLGAAGGQVVGGLAERRGAPGIGVGPGGLGLLADPVGRAGGDREGGRAGGRGLLLLAEVAGPVGVGGAHVCTPVQGGVRILPSPCDDIVVVLAKR